MSLCLGKVFDSGELFVVVLFKRFRCRSPHCHRGRLDALYQPQREPPRSACVCTVASRLLAWLTSQACTEKEKVVRVCRGRSRKGQIAGAVVVLGWI